MKRVKWTNKLKLNNAFTMTEMLIVVAITVILLGISTLVISVLMATLHMTEMDRYAKTIYLEAQNQLTAKEVEGGMPSFTKKIETDYANRFLSEDDEKPKDYEDEKNPQSWKQLCYITKSDDIMTELIYSVSDMYEGNYIIELNPETGDVYGVFYWENTSKKDLSAQELQAYYRDEIQTMSDRGYDNRSEKALGYYGGHMMSTTSPADFKLDQQVELINEEELYLKISYENSAKLLTTYLSSAFTVEAEIRDEHGHVWKGTADKNNSVAGTRLEIYFLLDSMESGSHFAELMQDDGLVAGDDLSITVTSTYNRGVYYRKEKSAPTQTNSLFSDVHKEGDTTIIEVAALRHLYNLNESVYKAENVSDGSYIVRQKADIDFETKNFTWQTDGYGHMRYVGADKGRRPVSLSTWVPLVNDKLFVNNTDAADISHPTVIDGQNYELSNFFVTKGEKYAGLFEELEYVEVYNLELVDFSVSAEECRNVGALAGAAVHVRMDNVGVHLTTYSELNGVRIYYNQQSASGYASEMERRVSTYMVKGGVNTGGLIGYLSNAVVTNSYAAIKTSGIQNVGGFAGNSETIEIRNCYSSGDVSAKTDTAGGFIGKTSISGELSNIYTTGDVYCDALAGGFVGVSGRTAYEDCFVYGEVLNADGTAERFISAGGFISEAGDNKRNGRSTNVYRNCIYLYQKGYNIPGNFTEPSLFSVIDEEMLKEMEQKGVNGSLSYSRLAEMAEENLLTGASYPYDGTLPSAGFPFKKVLEHHYGNWPTRYLINNALVYYEKYADGWYGYYSVTTLSATEDGEEAPDDYVWVLDTLRDEACVEDGYALLSIYNMVSFDYELYIGSEGKVSEKNKLTISPADLSEADKYGSDKAVILRQQGELSFRAYLPEDTEHSNTKDQISVDGMYLYQLPYSLQCTDRYGVENFYDKLVIYNGYAKGNTGAPVVGGSSATGGEALTFFYCPHFAKTAVNPGLGADGKPVDELATVLENPETVAIRSARQLNALGRFPYFWNKEGGNEDAIIYKQETDVNFGTYGRFADSEAPMYCGQIFDMGIGGNHANVPIGQPDLDDTYKQFRNTYDGMSNQIIDYCIESDVQFVGLFGEIQGATIRNVVMTASEPGKGIIRSCYLRKGASNKRAGLGALAGLVYVNNTNVPNVITNCSVSGYSVEYTVKSNVGRNDLPYGIAVGGMFGLCMSDITGCSAVNDIVFRTEQNYNSRAVFIGGLTGSFLYGTMKNCYAGGSIRVDAGRIGNNGIAQYDIQNLVVGGVCPGGLYTWEDNNYTSGARYSNVYSYTDIDESVWNIDDFSWLIPVVSNVMSCRDGNETNFALYEGDNVVVEGISRTENVWVENPWWRPPWGSGGSWQEQVVDRDVFVYYLEECYEKHMTHIRNSGNDTVQSYIAWENASNYDTKMADAVNYESLSAIEELLRPEGETLFKASYSYINGILQDTKEYPFPAVNTDAEGNYVHYGSWPLKEENP